MLLLFENIDCICQAFNLSEADIWMFDYAKCERIQTNDIALDVWIRLFNV